MQGTTITQGQCFGPKGGRPWMNVKSQLKKEKENCKKVIRSTSNHLHFTEDMIEEALELMEKVYDNELYRRPSCVKKAWCLVCIYVSARHHGYSLTMQDLSSFLDIDNGVVKFAAALKSLKLNYDVHVTSVGVSDDIYYLLSHSGLSADVLHMTQKLIMLLQRLMITQGRPILPCVVTCAYFAWKSSDFMTNKKVSVAAFCKMFKLNNKVSSRKGEIEKAFKKMAMEIPWVKASGLNIKHVEPHLNDIIKYQSLLISEAVRSALSTVDDQSNDAEDESSTDDIHVAKTFRKPTRKRLAKCMDEENDGCIEINGKLPRERHKSKHDEDDKDTIDENSDLVIIDLGSDDDTDLYILSEKEVEERSKLEKQLISEADAS